MKTLRVIVVLGCMASFILPASARVNGVWIDNYPTGIGQDPLGIQGDIQELGNSDLFPPDKFIYADSGVTDYRPCWQNPDDLQIPNAEVTITNLTERSWWDLHYVAEPETSLQNYDQSLLNGCLAFRIDNVGANTPLLYESQTSDGIFTPGETWAFVIQDYVNLLGLPASALGNPGVPGYGGYLSSGSIIARPVTVTVPPIIPEPATVVLFGLGVLSLIRKKK